MKRKSLFGRISDVDIRLLRVFRVVVSCGGLSAAESELNIGRSTISRHLADLELRLGVKLCDRGPAGFALTPEGERVLEASTKLLAAISDFQSDIDDVHLRLTGHLSIALFDKVVTNPQAHLAETIRLFDSIAPKATIEIHIEPINAIESGVLSGRFHLAIIAPHRQSSSLSYYPIYREQMYLYCGENHPLFACRDCEITQKDIRNCKYAGIGFHSSNMQVSHRLDLQRSADAYDEEALAVLILSGRYLGFLPDHYAQRFIETGAMRRLQPDAYLYESTHSVIVRRSPQPSRLVQEFLSCLLQVHSPAYRPDHQLASNHEKPGVRASPGS